MQVIFRGCRFVVTGYSANGIWLERFGRHTICERLFVALADPDLIAKPEADDLDLADMFERGDVRAFEYPDGHTFPPGREIPARRSDLPSRKFLIH